MQFNRRSGYFMLIAALLHRATSLKYRKLIVLQMRAQNQFTVNEKTHLNFCRYCVPPEHGKRLERLAKGMRPVEDYLQIFRINLLTVKDLQHVFCFL